MITYGIAWSCWLTAILLRQDFSSPTIRAPVYLRGLGPPVAGITLTYIGGEPGAWREYWMRALQVHRVRPRWYGVILLSAPVITGLAILLDRWLGGTGATWEESARHWLVQPWRPLFVAFFLFLFGPLPKELGWRGYALEQFQARWSAPVASLFLGGLWALWPD